MIPARKQPIFNALLRRWLTRVLRRRFHNVYVAGGEHLAALTQDGPVIGCVNHTNWWDGFVLYVFAHRHLPHEVYLAMEEANLRRYPFFTWMGVFGVDLRRTGHALPTLRYALSLLQGKRASKPTLLWMFVQGKLARPNTPVEVKRGASFLAAQARAQLLPLVIRYEWLGESRPSIVIRVGGPMSPDTETAEIGVTLNRMLAEVDDSLDGTIPSAYKPWFEPSMSMNKRWDRFLHRLFQRREAFDTQNHHPR